MRKVEGHSNLYKKGVAVVNADWSAYEAAKKKKAEREKVNQLESRLDKIEMLLEALLERESK